MSNLRGTSRLIRLMAILVSFVFIISIMNVEAGREIGYPKKGFAGEDRTNPYAPIKPVCDPKNPKTCPKQPANPYRRGCSKITRCRRDTD
ncbi:hypothetical protein CARUB_v10012633mg [Capsella rubella]|uniref:Uncharacterized protein n=1 Tax=Capsella rubella TaxID=81985 RepID=R0GPA0_9BRAS|nr:protein RALF-like 3 [Capsella rubella]EOA37772.1 hypothetical protein CARUB_v10012633mg [Capsella rubella]